ncbi:putative NADH-flavin reductase [Actinocorallia herbida]|uniref:Putative NADH-flavin reductase n=1 Tax=Actinocorallia herbida TaxID=58109 RepID=A0A3N1CUB0_9ACTN|nr:NAD(P)-binding oxidoreductase [Actinocorallia herbida]ROO84890.1 putative NADH-flavin reductase [Actinocorallia herbida]
MRVTIFGATGRTGHLLVQRALEAGHDVTAYARTPARLQIAHPALRVVVGELDDDAAIGEAVRGSDAVIEGVGSESGGTRRVVAAMTAAGVKRLVAVSTCSVPDAGDRPDPDVEELVRFVRTRAPGAYAEVRAAAEIVRASTLDWTLVRVAKLTDDAPSGARAGYYGRGEIGMSTSRADLAAFLLAQLTDPDHAGRAPAISSRPRLPA